MLACHALGDRPLPKVIFLSGGFEDAFELKRRLRDTAQLIVGLASADPISLLRRSNLGPTDSLVIDRRKIQPMQLDAIESMIVRSRLACRILFLHDLAHDAASRLRSSRDVAVGKDESLTAYAAAVHYGLGRHELLIEAMQALMPVLTTLGRDFVSEVLGSRFLFRGVSAIAQQLGVHRSRLHHRLVAAGDPPPKRLLDTCYALTTVMILRDPMLGTNDLLRFARASELRTLRDAVRRSTGMGLVSMRRWAQQDMGAAAISLIARRLREEAGTRGQQKAMKVPLRIYRYSANNGPTPSATPAKA